MSKPEINDQWATIVNLVRVLNTLDKETNASLISEMQALLVQKITLKIPEIENGMRNEVSSESSIEVDKSSICHCKFVERREIGLNTKWSMKPAYGTGKPEAVYRDFEPSIKLIFPQVEMTDSSTQSSSIRSTEEIGPVSKIELPKPSIAPVKVIKSSGEIGSSLAKPPKLSMKVKMSEVKPQPFIAKGEAVRNALSWAEKLAVTPSLWGTPFDITGCYNCNSPNHKLHECTRITGFERGTLCGACGVPGLVHDSCPFCYPKKFDLTPPKWYQGGKD